MLQKFFFFFGFFLVLKVHEGHAQVWLQKGIDIDGEVSSDWFGIAAASNADGSVIAVGANRNDGAGFDAGHVRVYFWNGTAWTQRGTDINGEGAHDQSGVSLDLSDDGNTLAIGAPQNDGLGGMLLSSGHVRVYTWSGTNWVQKGADIDGEAADDDAGYVSISSNGNILAVGASRNDAGGVEAGHVKVYSWSGTAWIQMGADINGEAAGDRFGLSVSLSNNGLTLAVGGHRNDGSGTNAGHVRVFNWTGSAWVQKGADIDGEAANDFFGFSLVLNGAGNILTIGGIQNDGGGTNSGHVRIYEWSGTTWVQKGGDINGQGVSDQFGYSVASSDDGLTIAAGAINGSAIGAGDVRVFNWSGSAWVQKGVNVDGEAANDDAGCAVDLNADATTLIVGAYLNDGTGGDAGHVRIYDYCNATTSAITVSVCHSFTVPSSDETYFVSGVYSDTLLNNKGCDSIISINLTIKENTTSSINVSACYFYFAPSGSAIYTVSGTYNDTLSNAAGCDSIVVIHLIINNSTSSSINVVNCNNYTVPSGDETYFTSGIYKDTIPNSFGCDSIITINLIINTTSTSSLNITACNNYTVPSGDETYTLSGTYTDTIMNMAGCDSVITIGLTINNPTFSSITVSECNSYTAPSGLYTYSASGTYLDTIPNAAGCDSIITINLTIESVNLVLTTASNSITVAETGASYQWLDCNNGFSPVSGAINQTYNLVASGSYAVEVTKGACTDTSICQVVTLTGIEIVESSKMAVFPNPARESVYVVSDGYIFSIAIIGVDGKVVQKVNSIQQTSCEISLGAVPQGLYLLLVETDEGIGKHYLTHY